MDSFSNALCRLMGDWIWLKYCYYFPLLCGKNIIFPFQNWSTLASAGWHHFCFLANALGLPSCWMDQVALLCSSFLHFLVYKYQFLLAPFDRINMYISHFFPISCIFILLLFHFEFISSPCVGRLGYYFPILPYYRRYYYPILRSPVIVVQQRPRLTNRNQATSITSMP